MRSSEERLAAVRRRTLEIETRRRKRHRRLLLVFSSAICLLILVGLAVFIPSVTVGAPAAEYLPTGATASIFDANSTLGYILVGFFAFALGAAMTILFYRIQARNKKEQDGNRGRTA